MTKKITKVNSFPGMVLLIYGLLFALPVEVTAAPKLVAVEGVSYNISSSLADNLKSFTGKKVNLTLKSGKNLAGLVKGVGDHLVHLEKLQGKEYFDALIRIEDISAIDSRFRKLQR